MIQEYREHNPKIKKYRQQEHFCPDPEFPQLFSGGKLLQHMFFILNQNKNK